MNIEDRFQQSLATNTQFSYIRIACQKQVRILKPLVVRFVTVKSLLDLGRGDLRVCPALTGKGASKPLQRVFKLPDTKRERKPDEKNNCN